MSIDGILSPSTKTAESRPQSWPGGSRRAEKVQFSSESPRIYSQTYSPAPIRTDDRSSQSSIFETCNAPGESDGTIWDKKTVLSFGGGGIPALCQLYFMKILFEKVAALEQSLDPDNKAVSSVDSPLFRFDSGKDDELHPKFRVPTVTGTYLPCHYFDYIGGTSVGGIIAVMFGRLRLSVDEGIQNFESIWKELGATMSLYDRVVPFRKAKISNSKGLDHAFQDIINQRKARLDGFFEMYNNSLDTSIGRDAVSDKFASDPQLCKTIVIAMPDRLENGLQCPFLFRSYDNQRKDLPSLTPITSEPHVQNIPISDICRATSAAPGFFKGVNIGDVKYRDGAIWTNNPAWELYCGIESTNSNTKDPIQLLVSLGSGRPKARKFQSQTRHSNKHRWGDDSSFHNFLHEKLGSGYWSFEGPSDLSDLEINKWRTDGSGYKTFDRICKSTEHYCQQKEVEEEIDRLAENLVKLRQSRARTTRWERFALGIQYTCRESPVCCYKSEKFDRDSFIDHLMWEHGEPPQDERNWNRIQKLLANSQTTTLR